MIDKDGCESQVKIHITGRKISGRKIIKIFFPKSLKFFLKIKIISIYKFYGFFLINCAAKRKETECFMVLM